MRAGNRDTEGAPDTLESSKKLLSLCRFCSGTLYLISANDAFSEDPRSKFGDPLISLGGSLYLWSLC